MPSPMIDSHLLAFIPLLPLLGALINGLGGAALQRRFGRRLVGAIGVAAPVASLLFAILAVTTLFTAPAGAVLLDRLYPWLEVGVLKADLSFSLDALSAVMVLVVTAIGATIHVYALGYMAKDRSLWRFFAYMNLFLFSMLVLVLADNLLLMFVGWEGVGLCSYLLIGFWYEDVQNARAGMKAFVVNRIGDFGFLVGFFLLFWGLGGLFDDAGYLAGETYSVTFRELPALIAASSHKTVFGVDLFTLVGLCFFVGATGKSAQLPLYVWLPDAMAGPTPVSALIHAATMVTAGVYMVARMSFVYVHSPLAMTVVACVGALTALFAATIGLLQHDIKKVLAYSTVSQLGYMFIGVGVGAYAAGVYHVLTHAFFKATLFLAAGSVILAMHHEQDMRKMGGLGRLMPRTRFAYWLACVAISGFPVAAGFYSKDEILWQAFNADALLVPGWSLWLLGFVAAGLTSFYMWRSYFLTFSGERATADDHGAPREQPAVITSVLIVLALGAVLVSVLGLPALWTGAPSWIEHALAPALASTAALPKVFASGEGHGVEWLLMASSVAVATLGLGLAAWLYRGRASEVPARLARRFARVHAVVYRKYYVDEAYDAVFVRGALGFSRLLWWLDARVVDGAVNLVATVTRAFAMVDGMIDTYLIDGLVNLVGGGTRAAGARLRRLQTGRVTQYLASLVLGAVALFILAHFLLAFRF